MKRLLLLICVFVLLPGCWGRSSNSATDPFFGYTRIPPPGTGSIYGQSADPYYPGMPNTGATSIGRPNGAGPSTLPANPGTMLRVAPNATPLRITPDSGSSTLPNSSPITGPAASSQTPPGSTAPSTTAPSTTAPSGSSGGSRYLPPNGFNYQGRFGSPMGNSATRVPPPALASRLGLEGTNSAAPHLADPSTKPADSTVGNVASRAPILQTIPPRPQATTISNSTGAAVPGASLQPGRSAARGQGVDIMDLPDASSSTTPDRTSANRQGNAFRLVSATEDATGQSKVVAAVALSGGSVASTARGRYGHGPEYRWLRGKLEHSQVDGCWKLRYIPIDGVTDDFGGSVVLPDASLLTGIERGEYVEARGKIGPREATEGFAPTYLATQIVKTQR